MLKRNSIKGALFIEFALIIAFVIGVGSYFVANSGIKDNILAIFEQNNQILSQAITPKKTVAEKNKTFVEGLLDRIADKFTDTKATSDNALWGYNNKSNQTLTNATDSECVDLKNCFATRWKKDNADYNNIADNLSYAFYANQQSDGSYTWTIYVYNPENNGGKKLSDYDIDYIKSSDNSIKTEVYQYNSNVKEIVYKGTETKKVASHFDGVGYNVIRDTGFVK